MSQQTNIAAALLRLANAIVSVNGRVGTLSALTSTDKTSLVAALNELKGIVSGLGSGVAIDDNATSGSTVWSSTKTQTQINAAITALISGAPGAQDTLAELAAQITALARYRQLAAELRRRPDAHGTAAAAGLHQPGHRVIRRTTS